MVGEEAVKAICIHDNLPFDFVVVMPALFGWSLSWRIAVGNFLSFVYESACASLRF